ncbi:hypothetical protein RB597_001078 [Gaeumannomyces tritici]
MGDVKEHSKDDDPENQQPRPNHLKPSINGDYYALRDDDGDDEEAQLLSPGAFNLEYEEGEATVVVVAAAAAAALAAGTIATATAAAAAPRGGLAAKLGWRGRQGWQWPRVVGVALAFGKRRGGGGGGGGSAGEGGRAGSGPTRNGGGGGVGGRIAHLLPDRARLAARLRGLSGRLRLDGPDPPLVCSISPLKADWQERPVLWLERKFPTRARRLALLVLFLACWLVLFLVPLAVGHSAAGSASATSPDQQPQAAVPVVHLDCTDTLWPRGNRCGLHGFDCRPFGNSSLAFHCPAGCASAGPLLDGPRSVGAAVVREGPLVVGDKYYRGDSSVCAAAIHAGVVGNAGGGCGVVRRLGPADVFGAADRNGVRSVPFDSYFPLAFAVDPGGGCGGGGGVDPRAALLAIDLLFSSVLVLFATDPPLIFFTVFLATFAHVGLASDPPPVSRHSVAVLPELLSTLSARLPPALVVAAVAYRVCVRRALGGSFPRTGLLPLRAQVEKLLLWLLPLWLGALANHTFGGGGGVPVPSSSYYSSLSSAGFGLLLALVAVTALLQAHTFWAEGRLRRLLVLYAGLATAVAAAAASAPAWGLELRAQPYAASLLLLPATAVQTRASLAAQGLLLGLFVHDVARRGFAPVLLASSATTAARRSSSSSVTTLPQLAAAPVIKTPPAGAGIWSISFAWASPPPPLADGVSVLVNDVERHRSVLAEPRAPGRGGPLGDGFVWARKPDGELPEYFRFAYTWDGEALDYTRAGVWHANGTWTPPPEPGAP